MEYRQTQFHRSALVKDMTFGAIAPGPGEWVPNFDLITTDGDRVRRTDYVGRRPLLITFGSVTCPMTASANPVLERLHDEFGDRVAFMTVYVREAHPGERFPQPDTLDQKLHHARALESRDHLTWRVAVDDIEGSFHQQMGTNSNAVYLMGTDGRVLYRGLWSNSERPLRRALEGLVKNRTGVIGQSRASVVPLLRGMGAQHDVLAEAGEPASRDLWREAPPMAALGELANVFRPLAPLGRGVAATALTTAALGALVGVGAAALAGTRRR